MLGNTSMVYLVQPVPTAPSSSRRLYSPPEPCQLIRSSARALNKLMVTASRAMSGSLYTTVSSGPSAEMLALLAPTVIKFDSTRGVKDAVNAEQDALRARTMRSHIAILWILQPSAVVGR